MMIPGAILTGCLILLASLSLVSGQCSTCLQEQCHDNGECFIGCVPGYVGKYCDEPCPSRCLNKACHIHIVSGAITCTYGCEPGYCDIICEVKCPGDCVTCDRQCSSCNVTVCPERRYGADCSRVCSERYGTCDRDTGQCIICRRGYYGDECKQECTGCFTRADNIRDTCLSGCEICQTEETCPVGFYGDSCKVRCSTGCGNPGGCNRVTGECSTGCVSGYHGLICNYTCNSFCEGGTCHQQDGACTYGCISCYKSKLDTYEKYDNQGSHWTVAFAVPIILVCLLAVMVTAAVICRRRRSRRSNRSQTEHGEKGTNGTDVVEPLLKYKKATDSVQQVPDRSIQADPTIETGSAQLLSDESVPAGLDRDSVLFLPRSQTH